MRGQFCYADQKGWSEGNDCKRTKDKYDSLYDRGTGVNSCSQTLSRYLPTLMYWIAVLEKVNLNRNNVDVLAIAQGVSEAVAAAVLAKVEVDGSNYQNDYADMSGYEVKPWCEPVPVVSTYI